MYCFLIASLALLMICLMVASFYSCEFGDVFIVHSFNKSQPYQCLLHIGQSVYYVHHSEIAFVVIVVGRRTYVNLFYVYCWLLAAQIVDCKISQESHLLCRLWVRADFLSFPTVAGECLEPYPRLFSLSGKYCLAVANSSRRSADRFFLKFSPVIGKIGSYQRLFKSRVLVFAMPLFSMWVLSAVPVYMIFEAPELSE